MNRFATLTVLAAIAALAGLSVARAEGEGISAADLLHHENGLWSLTTAGNSSRWVVIHNIAGADENTVLHIEVLARKRGAPAWSFDRLADHMAITVDALRRSVRKPLTHGAVYPEHFDYAFSRWKEQYGSGKAPVCTTTVDQCLATGVL